MRRFTNKEKAEMIEMCVSGDFTIAEVAKRKGVSATGVSYVLGLYFRKPKKNMVLPSKV